MIKKKDYELIAEAYELVMEKKGCTCKCKACSEDKNCKKCSRSKCDCKGCKCSKSLNECWDKIRENPEQLEKVEEIVGKQGHEKNNDYDMEWKDGNVVIKHKIKGSENTAERDIIVHKDGTENVHVHAGIHKESKDSIASHATFDPQQLIVNASRSNDPFHHGALAGYNYKIKQKGEGIIPPNTNKDGAAQEWQRGFDSILAKDDKAGKKEVEDGKVHTSAQDAAGTVEESAETLEEKKKMTCGKGCMCGKCPKCTPKKKTLKKALEEAYEAVLEEAKKKMLPT
jgi:hypothetical protein